MRNLSTIAGELLAAGLVHKPPGVLVTRWGALLSGETPIYLDAAHDSGQAVPGARYTFIAVTDTAVCYLMAEHDDPFWGHDPHIVDNSAERITPRSLVAWRRPATAISEIWLAGDAWQWMPGQDGSMPPIAHYSLRFGDDEVLLPLPCRFRASDVPVPDPAPAIARVTDAWRALRP